MGPPGGGRDTRAFEGGEGTWNRTGRNSTRIRGTTRTRVRTKAIDARLFAEPIRSLHRRAGHVAVPPGTTIGEAARIMKEHRVGCVLVEAEGRLLGIFTERDILTKLVGTGYDPAKVAVDGVMTRNPETLTPEDPDRLRPAPDECRRLSPRAPRGLGRASRRHPLGQGHRGLPGGTLPGGDPEHPARAGEAAPDPRGRIAVSAPVPGSRRGGPLRPAQRGFALQAPGLPHGR